MNKWIQIAERTSVMDLEVMGLVKVYAYDNSIQVVRITSNEAKELIKLNQVGDIDGNN